MVQVDRRPIRTECPLITMTLRTLHRSSAILIAVFACIHFANHLAGRAGVVTQVAKRIWSEFRDGRGR